MHVFSLGAPEIDECCPAICQRTPHHIQRWAGCNVAHSAAPAFEHVQQLACAQHQSDQRFTVYSEMDDAPQQWQLTGIMIQIQLGAIK